MASPQHIVGHQAQLSELLRDLQKGNVAHAYLFTGPRHIGKSTIGRWFTTELLCQGRAPAQHQNVVEQIRRLIHPDFLSLDALWVEGVCEDWNVIAHSSNIPQRHRSKVPKAKTDVISIEDVRALQDRLYETGMGQYRCCLIRSVERMQEAAANAFLKILEEPPEGRVFFLTTQSLSSLPPTMISRTRVLRFRRVAQQELQPLLSNLDSEDVQFFLRVAQGAPGIVQQLKSNPELLRGHRLLHARACSFWQNHSLLQRLQLLDVLTEKAGEAEQFLFHLALALQEHPTPSPSWGIALRALCRAFRTPVQRQLLTQQFALAVSA